MAEENITRPKKKAKVKGAKVVFEDEVSFQQEGTTRQSWARRGVGFTVHHHPCRRRSKYFGAISVSEHPSFIYRKSEKFNSRTYERFLEDILDHYGKVCLIVDNVPYHGAKRLQPFFKANKHRLWIYNLPPYSPELNAIEMVWRETKKDATHNRYFATPKGLTRAVQTQFRTYQAEPWQLAGIVANFLLAQYTDNITGYYKYSSSKVSFNT